MSKSAYETYRSGLTLIRGYRMQSTTVAEGLPDDSGNNDHGVFLASVVDGDVGVTPGPFPGTVAFDVVSDDNFTNAQSSAGVAAAASRTYNLWVKPDNFDAFYGVFGSGTSTTNRWSVLLRNDGTIQFCSYVSSAKSYITNGALTVNEWNMVTCVADASNNLTVYINGTLDTGGTTGTTDAVVVLNVVSIGDTNGALDLDGKLAYADVITGALTADQIASWLADGLASDGYYTNIKGPRRYHGRVRRGLGF